MNCTVILCLLLGIAVLQDLKMILVKLLRYLPKALLQKMIYYAEKAA